MCRVADSEKAEMECLQIDVVHWYFELLNNRIQIDWLLCYFHKLIEPIEDAPIAQDVNRNYGQILWLTLTTFVRCISFWRKNVEQ